MSVAEAPPAPRPSAPGAPVSTRFFRSELRLIFGRRRNWVGLAVLAAVPVIIAVATKIWPPTAARRRRRGPSFFTSITSNGLFVALAALTVELPLFLPLAVAAIAGDAVAGEANLGTLRYLLAGPVHRTRLLLVKYAASWSFAFAATLSWPRSGCWSGLALFGGGDVTLLSGTQVRLRRRAAAPARRVRLHRGRAVGARARSGCSSRR